MENDNEKFLSLSNDSTHVDQKGRFFFALNLNPSQNVMRYILNPLSVNKQLFATLVMTKGYKIAKKGNIFTEISIFKKFANFHAKLSFKPIIAIQSHITLSMHTST
jgi:hypothetical protein